MGSLSTFGIVLQFNLEIRSLGVAGMSALHFLCQFSSSRSVDPIINSGGPHSSFISFFVMSLASVIFVFFMMPEVSGYSLERVKGLFDNKPWYLGAGTQNRAVRFED